MNEIEFALRQRRLQIASRSVLDVNSIFNGDENMADFNSKVDLRPLSMINKKLFPSGKPHVDSVLCTEQRNIGIPIANPELLNQIRSAKLKPTGRRSEIEEEGNRSVDLSPSNPSSATFVDPQMFMSMNNKLDDNFRSDSEHSLNIPPPPPPPELPPLHATIKKDLEEFTEIEQIKETVKEIYNKIKKTKREQEKLEKQIKLNAVRDKEFDNSLPSPKHSKSNCLQNQIQQETQQETNSNLPLESFRIGLLKDDKFQTWINQMVSDKFERESRLDGNEFKDHQMVRRPEMIKEEPRRGRSLSAQKKKRKEIGQKERRSRSRESILSRHSTKSRANSVESFRSIAKSMKSVMFKNMEEEELRSEISDEDVADRDVGDISFIDYTSNKFTIHGPFIDKELNVFHAICKEYELAARMSFAKRNPFARTNPAFMRVYALIGSNRRSSWTNRSSWTQATTELQILDYLFRKTIRSETRVIKQPVIELEYFSEGSSLDSRRFKHIMRSTFQKRDQLMTSLGIEIKYFDEIK